MAHKPKLVTEDPNLPPLARAAHIGMLVLSATGCNTWATLVGSPENHARVTLSNEQQAVLDEHAYILQFLQLSPTRTLVLCEDCGRWFLSERSIGKATKCTLTVGCEGELHYVKKTNYRGAKDTTK